MIDQGFVSNLLAWAFQVALITAVTALLLVLLRVDAPSIRYASWQIVFVLCLALPVLQPWQRPRVTPAGLMPAVSANVEPVMGAGAHPAISAGSKLETTPLVSWPAALGIVLVAGAAVRLVWLGAGLLRLRRLRRAGERAAPCDWHDEIAGLTEPGAEIRYVPVLGQPVTFGVRRPVVLLPESLRALPDDVQRAVLAHELWHVRRRDWIWVLAEEGACALLWFHPAIWFLVSCIQSAREEVVDELTVLLTNSRRSYLQALLAFADQPPLFAAAPFARRRHLFQRMLLISREAVMSSRRIVVSGGAMVLVMLATVWAGATAFPLTAAVITQQPPRDARPGAPRPASSRETELQKAIAAAPQASVTLYFELAKLQENRNAIAEAEATLQAGREAFPGHEGMAGQLTAFYNRRGDFEKAVGVYEEIAAADPSNPAAHHRVAAFYEEKVRKSHGLSPSEKGAYIHAGLAASDRALTYDPDYVDALVYKNILLRHQAILEADGGRKAQLIAEADALRNRALELNKARASAESTSARTTGVQAGALDGQAPVRVGGSINPPTKIRDVRPVYPPVAIDANVQGVVIAEVLIDASGRVQDAKILRSIPLLDEAALDAVRQWEFRPTLLNGQPVAVIMTVTVNFTR